VKQILIFRSVDDAKMYGGARVDSYKLRLYTFVIVTICVQIFIVLIFN